jgi:glycerol-3-phosphate O-acyltransferase / dihydroxyacetone phosphate acyltransferase
MLYNLLRPLTRLTLLVFYRKIYLTGKEKVVKKGPVIFTANHPTAFVDPCFLACFSGRTLHFMTRGDIFANSFVRRLLDQIHLIPIYRFKDGYSNLKKNDASFNRAKEILAGGDGILIMAEGGMRHEKRLRPIQKGAARIGFEAMQTYDLPNIAIQPVGYNYHYGDRGATRLMVDIGASFDLSEYYPLYLEQPQKALDQVTKRIAEELSERVIHIQDPEDDQLAEFVLQMVRDFPANEMPLFSSNDRTPLETEMKAAAALNQMSMEEKGLLRENASEYYNLIQNEGLTEAYVKRTPEHKPLLVTTLIGLVFIVPLFAILRLLYAIPLIISHQIAKKGSKIIEFRSSVLIGSLMFLTLIWVTGIAVTAFIMWGLPGLLYSLIIFVVSALLLVYSFYTRHTLLQQWRWLMLDKVRKVEIIEARAKFKSTWRELAE